MYCAFSLVEMLLVIAIIGILLALMLPVFAKAIDEARKVGRPRPIVRSAQRF